MSGVKVSNDLMNMLTIFCWQYFAFDISSVHQKLTNDVWEGNMKILKTCKKFRLLK